MPTTIIPTGIAAIDEALILGGIPGGHITELLGEESTGKSWLTLRIIASAQQAGKVCMLLDTEGAFDACWATKNGVDTTALVVVRPSTIEQTRCIIDEALFGRCCDVLVIDSLDGLAVRQAGKSIITPFYTFLPHLHTLVEALGTVCVVTNHLTVHNGVPTSFANDLMREYATIRATLARVVSDDSGESADTAGIDLRLRVRRHNLAPHTLGEALFRIQFNK